MASVRKRTWKSGGEMKTAWVADYSDQSNTRRLKTFTTKKAADAWMVQARAQVAGGIHSPESSSITLASAAALWIARAEADDLERSTLVQYRSHVKHISNAIGTVKLARLSAPMVESFKDDLLKRVSRPLAKKILVSLKSILSEAQRRGLVGQNAAGSVKIKTKSRDESKLAIGLEIPTKAEINQILALTPVRWRPLLITVVFTGMRSSELRGLKWEDVDFKRKVIHVRQRADQWGVIGPPKSKAGQREIPMSPLVVNALREWKLACPKLDQEGTPATVWLVFPNGQGTVESHANIINRALDPILIEAGLTNADKTLKREDGTPVLHTKYGLHGFRHFFASWAIEQGFSPKKLQALLGHSSIAMTYDVYGHLFPSIEDDHAKFAAGEAALLK
jgi:integrase